MTPAQEEELTAELVEYFMTDAGFVQLFCGIANPPSLSEVAAAIESLEDGDGPTIVEVKSHR